MIKILKVCRGSLVMLAICAILVPINMFQLLTLAVLPFDRKAFMRINMSVKQFFGGFVVAGARLCGNTLVVTGEPPKAENSLVFANHQSMSDIILIWSWAHHVGTIGWIKWFAKDVLKYIPGLGWGMMFLNTLFVKRDWAKDADSIRATFAKLRDGQLPTWLVIFPEGTRMKPAKFATSRAYAQRKGLPVLDHVLIPRGRGIHACLQGMSGHLQTVYDVTIQYEGGAPQLLAFFLKGGYKARLHATRYDPGTLPERERDLNQWILEVFMKKDQLLAHGLERLSPPPQ
jgi:1-acyl-sn-glycerol-3-phosphate acyltransferase